MTDLSPDLRVMRSYVLRYDIKPLTMNGIRGMHWAPYNNKIEDYKNTFAWLAKIQKVPAMDAIDIIVRDTYSGTKPRDTSACAPAVKAAVDGLVMFGVVPDDSPKYVRNITYAPPVRGKTDSLELELFEALS